MNKVNKTKRMIPPKIPYYVMPGLIRVYRIPKTVEGIIQAVCRRYEVSYEELRGSCRAREIVFARHLAMYLLRKHTPHSFPYISALFERHHTSVIHACRTIENYIETDGLGRRDEILSIY